MERCKAKARSGKRCRQAVVPSMKVCRYHGGLSKRGIDSPTFKHGRYSKYLPARLLDRYQQAASDPQLLEMRDEIALVDARLGDLLKRIDKGEAGEKWIAAKKVFTEFKEANIAGDVTKQQDSLLQLNTLLDKGQGDYLIWEEIGRTIDQRRKLVESERKRLIELQQVITAEQAMLFLARVTDIIKTNVTDPIAFSKISRELIQLSTIQPRPIIDAGVDYTAED